jgi:hypothetical protein
VTRLACFSVAMLCLAACGSSSTTAPPTQTSAPRSSTSASTTTRPITTTTKVNGTVADQFTQLALTTAVNAAHDLYRQSYDYTSVTPASLAPLVPGLHLGTFAEASDSVIGVMAQDRNDVLLIEKSASGRWYCVTDNAMDGISYGSGTTRESVNSNGECQQPAWPPPGN